MSRFKNVLQMFEDEDKEILQEKFLLIYLERIRQEMLTLMYSHEGWLEHQFYEVSNAIEQLRKSSIARQTALKDSKDNKECKT